MKNLWGWCLFSILRHLLISQDYFPVLTVVSWEENIEDLDEIQQIVYIAKHLFDQTGQLAHLLSLIPPLYITH